MDQMTYVVLFLYKFKKIKYKTPALFIYKKSSRNAPYLLLVSVTCVLECKNKKFHRSYSQWWWLFYLSYLTDRNAHAIYSETLCKTECTGKHFVANLKGILFEVVWPFNTRNVCRQLTHTTPTFSQTWQNLKMKT